MNEARCLSDTYPSGPACVPGSETITTWYKEQSDFVRSLYVQFFVTEITVDIESVLLLEIRSI